MAISDAKTCTAPVLLKESDITKASDAGRKPAELGKANLLLWQRFKRDRANTARKTTVYFLCFTWNDAGLLVTINQIRVKVKQAMIFNFFAKFFGQTALFFTK